MLLKIAIDTIQRQVKKELGLSKIPPQSSSASIKKLLAEMGFTEPHDREHCTTIATMIIDQYHAENAALTLVEPVQDQPPIEAVGVCVPTEEAIKPIDWQEELTGESLQPDSENLAPRTTDAEHTPASTEPAPLTYPVDDAKRGMVNYKAVEMGISLAATEVDVIASRVDASSSSFTQTISDIESALIAYVDFQQSQESNQVGDMLTRVSNRVIEKNRAVKESLATGINRFTSALEVAEQHQKSELSAILTRLKR